jgi:hypothetical protein
VDKYVEQRTHLMRMVERDKELQRARLAYERMSRGEYHLPEPLNSFEWVRPVISASPYVGLNAATRAFANKEALPTVNPATVLKALGKVDADSKTARKTANDWEKNLRWQMSRMEERGPALRASVMWSALLYDEIVGQLIHLPTQFKAKPIGKVREAAALRMGDWALRLVDPKTTYIDYSEFMPERIACVTQKTAQQIIDFWGPGAKKISSRLKAEEIEQDTPYLEVDFTDYDNRVVWAIEGTDIEQVVDEDGITLFGPEPWLKDAKTREPAPFLSWIAVAGGNDIDCEPEHQRRPMLYPLWTTEQWANANIFGSILMGLATAEAAAPTNVFEGVGAENVEIDYTQAGGRVDLPSQYVTYQRVQRLGLAPALSDALAMFETAQRRCTVAEVLVTGSPTTTGGTFSAYNLEVMQALASLGGPKGIAERFLSQLWQKMLLMSHYTGSDITGYGKDNERYTIDSEDIDPEHIYVSASLQVDAPVDQMQRAASAVQMSQSLPYAPQKILEQLGETDPEGSLALWKRWRLELADFEGWLQKIKMTASGEIEQLAQQMAQQMIQQMQQQGPQGQQQGVQPEGMSPGLGLTAGPQPNPNAPPGTALEGQGFNPAGGGAPPAMASPGATFEGQRGRSRGGQEAQGGY